MRRASALRVLASARPVWRSAILEDALERQTPLDEIVDHLVSQSTESQWGEGQVKVMGFVDFVSVEVSASRRGR